MRKIECTTFFLSYDKQFPLKIEANPGLTKKFPSKLSGLISLTCNICGKREARRASCCVVMFGY